MDTLSIAERSRRMSLIRSKNTKPELTVRRQIARLRLRYQMHVRDLPGNPDLVFRSRKKVIFVHGCFWHRHAACKGDRIPKSKLDFWVHKLEENRKRDRRNLRKLNRMGWHYLVVWECQLKDEKKLLTRLKRFLGGSK